MKWLLGFITLALLPLSLFGTLGVIVSLVWLGILGKWGSIFLGLGIAVCSVFYLGLATLPVHLFSIPAAWFQRRHNHVGYHTLTFFGLCFEYAILTIWCVGIMYYFVYDVEKRTLIPMLLWSYGVATAPLSWASSKDPGNIHSSLPVFSAAIAMALSALWIVLGTPSLRGILMLFCSVMAVGVLIQEIDLLAEKPNSNPTEETEAN